MKKYLEKIKTKTLETIDSCGCYAFTFYVLMIAAIIVHSRDSRSYGCGVQIQ